MIGKIFKAIGAVFLLLIIIGIFAGNDDKSVTPATETQSTPQEPLAEFTPQDIAVAYNKNTVAADQKFKNKRFIIKGRVTDITTDIFDNAVVHMSGGVNQFMEPQFQLQESQKSMAGNLNKGDQVTLECTGKGDIAKTPMHDDCIFL